MTKAELIKERDEMKDALNQYKEMGSPAWIKEQIEAGNRAKAVVDTIKMIIR